MRILFLALWLQMSGVGEIKFTPQNQYVQFPTDTGYIRCPANPGTLPLACKTSDGKEVTVGIVPRAADETDGKAKYPVGSVLGWYSDPNPPSPVDVPAVQVCTTKIEGWRVCPGDPSKQTGKGNGYRYSCADKARILEHDENSPPKYWCRKVEF